MRKYASSTVSVRSLSICIVVLFAASVFAAAQHGKYIHSFEGLGDGADPMGTLIADAAGNLYGTTFIGGNCEFACGTVFELSPPVLPGTAWTETVLYSFTGGTDGAGPYAGVVFDLAGNLYGTTYGGGNPSCFGGGCGVVFELSPPSVQGGSWTEATIYTFSGGSDGGMPLAGLILDGAGNLYGTASLGGIGTKCNTIVPGCGTVFELSPPTAPGAAWTETVLYSFTGGSDGGEPTSPVVFDKEGNLYGTTFSGGLDLSLPSFGFGTVFELSPTGGEVWRETVLHSFSNANGDGCHPYGALIFGGSGALAGTTENGGAFGDGTVFVMGPPSGLGEKRSYEVLHSFGDLPDGSEPLSGVIAVNGVLYGTTLEGGFENTGTVFQLSRTAGGVWKETVLFTGESNGGAVGPFGGLLLHNGSMYGTSRQGGDAGWGTVFEIGK
jgi:uncharacterized repeat protein (TIGR03803 family)